MKKTLTIILSAALLGLPLSAQRNGGRAAGSPKPAATDVTQLPATTGLFSVKHSADEWYFEIPDSLLGRRILATVRFTTTPANTSKYGGEQVNQQTVYWEKAPGGQLMLRSDLFINVADSVDAINRAVISSNSNPIIGTFKVESYKNASSLIKVTSFFNDDNPALGVSKSIKSAFGLQGYVSSASYIESIKTFPLNTEIRTVKTWSSQSGSNASAAYTGRVTLGLNVSFVLLPEQPMPRRLFDPRVGYFTDDFTYYSDDQQRVSTKRFITRWRLEPKDSADAERMKRGELIEPKKPIVYYIDPATPPQWRPYLIQGVNDWQKAFEQAGFKNAIMAREWPENDSTMSMEDARYSVIRYLASPIPNAYGPQVHDPRSGEILESHICWYHNVMTLVHDWYMIQAGTIDEAARQMKYDPELMGQLIRFVSSHEVGHTLGLRHNFGASSTVPVDSLRNKAWVEAHGHTPSIMDYARFNYVAQPEDSISRKGIFPRIGDYDCWAIQWGYTPMPDAYDDESDHWELEKLTDKTLQNNRRLWFGDGETNTTNDPRCQTEDLGDDAVLASHYGILNLKRELRQLPEWTYQSNDIYGTNLSSMYSQIVSQFRRYVNHVATSIAGVLNDYKTPDQPGSVYTAVSRQQQTRALQFLDSQVLTEPGWLISLPYISRITPRPQQVTANVGSQLVRRLARLAQLESMTDTYPAPDYLADLTDMLFRETAARAAVTAYRQTLQREYVATLAAAFREAAATSPARAAVLSTLRTLRTRLGSATAPDAATRQHYAALADLIDRTLVIK